MGRKRQRKRPRISRDEASPRQPHENGEKFGYKTISKSNPDFEKYYKAQGIVPEGEWDDFMAALRRDLPAAFRITHYFPEAKHLLSIIKSQYFEGLLKTEGGEGKTKPINLGWYPDKVAWQLGKSRVSIRKEEVHERLHSFLVDETKIGAITRQEAVSMIPPLLLDVQPSHKVLDMCAAPGSKTAQLLEMLQTEHSEIPTGLVVANDLHNKRSYMLVHQANRLKSAACIVTNHDAAIMPNIYLTMPDGSQEVMKYDRVLCDVPCSGDGTLRKNADMWRKWNGAGGHNQHGVQTRILRRGLELLVRGGLLVYSTCSMNPVEDEAVLANILQQCDGTVELVEVKDFLPGLVCSRGLTTWKIANRNLDLYSSFDEVPAMYHTQIRPHMFPPPPEMVEELHLERCMRILPHQQDSGAFFVAVLKKLVDQLPWESSKKQATRSRGKSNNQAGDRGDASAINAVDEMEEEEKLKEEEPEEEEAKEEEAKEEDPEEVEPEEVEPEEEEPEDEEPKPKEAKKEEAKEGEEKKQEPGRLKKPKEQRRGRKENPFVFLRDDSEIWTKVRNFFGMSSSFPNRQLMGRSEQDDKRNIYLVSNTVRNILETNGDKIKVINTGVKVLTRCEGNDRLLCDYRICQQGASIMMPYVSRQLVQMTRDDVYKLLTEENPQLNTFSPELRNALEHVENGCILLVYYHLKGTPHQFEVVLTARKGKSTVRCYVAKEEKVHYLRICDFDVSQWEKRGERKETGNAAVLAVAGTQETAEAMEEGATGKVEGSTAETAEEGTTAVASEGGSSEEAGYKCKPAESTSYPSEDAYKPPTQDVCQPPEDSCQPADNTLVKQPK